MQTDGIECVNKGCRYHDESMTFSCSKGSEPQVRDCEEFMGKHVKVYSIDDEVFRRKMEAIEKRIREAYTAGVRISRKLTLWNPEYVSVSNGKGIVLMDETGAPIKVFSGKGWGQECNLYLFDRLLELGVPFRKLNAWKIKTANYMKAEQMLTWATEDAE